MQRIERYGVIALVLLLVTIAAVSFWEDDQASKGDGTGQEVARSSQGQQRSTPRDADRTLPATADPSAASRERNRRAQEQAHLRRLAAQTNKREQGRQAALVAAQKGGPDNLDFPKELVQNGQGNRSASPVPQSEKEVLGNQGNQRSRNQDLVRNEPVDAPKKVNVIPPKDAPRAKQATPGYYVVKANETLGEIAYKELGSSKLWPEIAALNGGSDRIYEGQKLVMPREGGVPSSSGKPATPATGPANNEAVAATGAGTYVVKKGDMLSVIAQKHLGSAKRWPDIVALNPGLDPDRLLEGARLVMPEGDSSAGKPSSRVALANTTPTPRKKRRVQ